MTLQKQKVCFIDDDKDFEIPLFQSLFADDFDLVCASSFAEADNQIRKRRDWNPSLFVLDLYLPDLDPDNSRLRQMAENPLELTPDKGAILQAYLNQEIARQRLQQILNIHHQSYRHGIQLAGDVHSAYPRVPIVFYTRKATIEEILESLQLPGVVQVIRKPSGSDASDTRRLTMQQKQRLLARFQNAISLSGTEKVANLKRCCQTVTSYLRHSELMSQ